MNLPTLQRHAPYLPGVEASGAAVMYEPTPGQLEQRALSPLPLLVMGSFNGTPIAEDQLESMAAAADGVMETAVMEGVMEECDSWAQEDQAALVQRVESGRVGSGLAQVRGRGCGNGLVDELVTPLDTGGDEEGDQQQQGPSTGGRGLLEESASLMGMENTPSDSPACGEFQGCGAAVQACSSKRAQRQAWPCAHVYYQPHPGNGCTTSRIQATGFEASGSALVTASNRSAPADAAAHRRAAVGWAAAFGRLPQGQRGMAASPAPAAHCRRLVGHGGIGPAQHGQRQRRPQQGRRGAVQQL